MGHRMRFIPNIMSDRFIIAADERRMAKKARSKQTRFLESMISFSNYQIVGLRYPLAAYNGITLHEALSGLRSRKDPDIALFFTMEDLGSKVVFLFHKDRADEAMPMIPALPRVMEALIGPDIWSWFDDSAKADCEGYAFDLQRGVYSTNSNFDADFDEWSDADSVDEDLPTASDAAFSLQLGSTGAGQWDDTSMKTFLPSSPPAPSAPPPAQISVSNTSPLSSSFSSPSNAAILQAARDDPALLAQLLLLAASTPASLPTADMDTDDVTPVSAPVAATTPASLPTVTMDTDDVAPVTTAPTTTSPSDSVLDESQDE